MHWNLYETHFSENRVSCHTPTIWRDQETVFMRKIEFPNPLESHCTQALYVLGCRNISRYNRIKVLLIQIAHAQESLAAPSTLIKIWAKQDRIPASKHSIATVSETERNTLHSLTGPQCRHCQHTQRGYKERNVVLEISLCSNTGGALFEKDKGSRRHGKASIWEKPDHTHACTHYSRPREAGHAMPAL